MTGRRGSASGAIRMTAGSILAGFNRSVADATAGFEAYLRRPGAVPILIIVLWACAVLPNLPLRAFIYEEGTNAEIARDILARGDFLQPYVYGFAGTRSLHSFPG